MNIKLIVLYLVILIILCILATTGFSYRLGDIINGVIYRKYYIIYLSYPILYRNSIATKYINKVKILHDNEKWNNLNILDKLTKSNEYIDVDLHLRTGDIIGMYDNKNNRFKPALPGYQKYFYQPESYIKIAEKMNEMNINKVHVFYGSHNSWFRFDTNNKLYIKKVKKVFNNHNIEFIHSSTNNADKDFILMSNSKIFIQSGGGYSKFIADLILKRGNTVIIPERE